MGNGLTSEFLHGSLQRTIEALNVRRSQKQELEAQLAQITADCQRLEGSAETIQSQLLYIEQMHQVASEQAETPDSASAGQEPMSLIRTSGSRRSKPKSPQA